MNNNNKEKKYFTRDIYLAAVLMYLKFPMIEISYQYEGSRQKPVGYFGFEKTSFLDDAVQKYWNGNVSVEPRAFVVNFRSLYAQINEKLKSPYSDMK